MASSNQLTDPNASENWRNRVAIVTGASVGIGACIAIKLANAGIHVVGLARRPQLVEELNQHVKCPQGKIYGVNCDIRDEESIRNAFVWVRERFHVIHILINNAGCLQANFLTESDGDSIKQLIDVNLYGAAICMREAIQSMRETKTKGHIIVLNSTLGHRIPDISPPLFSVYPATKHALTALCQTVRQEIHFFKLNIKLTSISPGLVDTDLLKVYSSAVDELPKLKVDDVADAVLYALETPNYVQIEEIILQAMRRYDE